LITTASAAIGLARRLEEESAGFYQALSKHYPEHAATLAAFASDNRKNVQQIERAYYGVISDALEGCFAFNLDEAAWEIDFSHSSGQSVAQALARAMELEVKIIDFYTLAAQQSKGLMADVPRAFLAIARRHEDRLTKIQRLVGG